MANRQSDPVADGLAQLLGAISALGERVTSLESAPVLLVTNPVKSASKRSAKDDKATDAIMHKIAPFVNATTNPHRKGKLIRGLVAAGDVDGLRAYRERMVTDGNKRAVDEAINALGGDTPKPAPKARRSRRGAA